LTTVAIHQPQYLPWLPFLAKAAGADTFVFMDDVQFQKNGVQNRNQIKSSQGPVWLTVPVRASIEKCIAETEIADQRWVAKHLRTIEQNYAKAPFRDDVLHELAPILNAEHAMLGTLNVAICSWMFTWAGLEAASVCSSQWPSEASKEERVIELCSQSSATAYLSGRGARVYQDPDHFRDKGIELIYQTFAGVEYAQCHPKAGFVPHLSALDAFMNLGKPDTRALIAECSLLPVPAAELTE
jgi:hypothetical protein